VIVSTDNNVVDTHTTCTTIAQTDVRLVCQNVHKKSRAFEIILCRNVIVETPMKICHYAHDSQPSSFVGCTIAIDPIEFLQSGY